jgi:hypothetical protein
MDAIKNIDKIKFKKKLYIQLFNLILFSYIIKFYKKNLFI